MDFAGESRNPLPTFFGLKPVWAFQRKLPHKYMFLSMAIETLTWGVCQRPSIEWKETTYPNLGDYNHMNNMTLQVQPCSSQLRWHTSGRAHASHPLSFIYFYFSLVFNFTILYWFCHISTWIRHRYTHVPRPEPSSLLPPRTIPLGHPSAPAPSIQYRALNLDWRLTSYMILYMF